MVGSIKSRKVVDPKLNVLNGSQYSAVEKNKLLASDLLKSPRNFWDTHGQSKRSNLDPSANPLSTSCRSVGFKEPLVAYHEENDPFPISIKEKQETPKDRPAVARFLNTSDLEPVRLSSSVTRQRLNATGVARTVTQPTDSMNESMEPINLSSYEKHSSFSLPDSARSSVKKRHVAEILKQSQKLDKVPDTLAKLKETIQKQKENRSPNTSYSPQRKPFYNHDDMEVTPALIPHAGPGEMTPIRKIAAGPVAPNYKGFSAAKTRLQTPDGKIWKEDNLLKQHPSYKPKTQKDFSVVSKPPGGNVFRNTSNLNRSQGKRKPVRKLGKITSTDPIQQKSIITPSSWREGHKVAEAILNSMSGKKVENTDSKKDTSTTVTNDGSNTTLKHDAEEDNPVEQLKNSSTLSVQAKTVLDDLNLLPSEDTAADTTESKINRSKSSVRRPAKRKPLQITQKDSPEIPKTRHYDPAQVQQYMAKQKADRKRRQIEMKKKEKEANEKRQRLLNDLDKRQKEARKKTISEGFPKEKKLFQDTYTKASLDIPLEANLGYEERLAAFMQKLDKITKTGGDSASPESKSTISGEPPSKFLMKLGECMQEPESPQTAPLSHREERERAPLEMRPSIHLQPMIESRLELTLTKRDRIAALRAKSESLQERIDLESNRLLEPANSTQNFTSINKMYPPLSTERSKPDAVLDVETLLTKNLPGASFASMTSPNDISSADKFPFNEPADQERAFELSTEHEHTPRSFLGESFNIDEQSTLHGDYPGNNGSFNVGPTQSESSATIADIMYRLNKEEYCAKNNSSSWKEKWQANSKEEPSHFSLPRTDEPYQYGAHSTAPYDQDLPPWQRMNGDKYSVMNVFTRRFLKSAKPTSSGDVPSPTRQRTPISARDASPIEPRSQLSPEPSVSRPLSIGGARQDRPQSPPPPDPTSELIRWGENLPRKEAHEVSVVSEDSLSVSDTRMPPMVIPPPQPSTLRYSPAVLEHKFALELNRYETIGEQIHQLEGSERTQGVAMAQQETVSIAQILQSRQMQHELEMERLASKAKEKAVEANQKLQTFQMDSTAKEAKQQEKTAEEKRKMASELHDEALKSLQLQTEVAQASIKALSRHRGSPSYRDTSEYSSYTPSAARRKAPGSYSTTYDSFTETPSHQRRLPSDEQSPTPMSEHSTTSLRPPVDEDESIREEIEGSSSSSIKEEFSATQHTESSISEQTFVSPRDDQSKKVRQQRDVTSHDGVHFDESMTEDEKIELSKKAVMPSESHRRQKYKKSPRVAYQSQHSDVSSDDIPPAHNRSYLSGLDDSILSSASLFGDADASSFNRFMNDHVRQYMLEEEVRTRHQAAMLKLREKALKEKTKTELAWVEFQKRQIRNKGEDDRMPPLKKKKRAILRRWQVETEEIKRLKAANKAASQDRELLKQQRKDISRMIHNTQQMKERMKAQGGDLLPGELKSSTPVPLHTEDSIATDSDIPSGSETNLNTSTTGELLKKLRKSVVGLDGRRLTTREKALLKRKKEAEKLLEWKRKLDEEERKVYDIEQQAMQAWNQKDKPIGDKDTLQKSDLSEKSPASSSISEDIHPHEATEASTLRSDMKEDLRVPDLSSEETIGEEYSQSFASTEPTSSQSDTKQHEKDATQDTTTNKSSTLRQKTDESSVPLLGRKGAPTGTARRREPLESWSDESFSQTQSETEQSDVECRVHALKEELKRRRLIADRLKKQQKKKQKEHLRAQEASLKSQIEAYDAFIKTTQQELNLELDSPSSGTPSILSHPPAAKPQIRSPRKSDQNRHISRSFRNSVSSLSSPDASPRAGSQKHPIGSVLARQQSDSESSGRSSRSLSFDDEQHSPDDVTTPNSGKFLPSQSSDQALDATPTHTDRPKKLEISSNRPLRSMIPVASPKHSSSGKSQEKQLASKPSLQQTLTSLPKITTSPTETEVDKDVSIATEEEVSERLSETSNERSGDSIPLFQVNEKVPDIEEDDDKTPVGSPMTTPTPSLPQTPTPEHPENLSLSINDGIDVSDGTISSHLEPLLILPTPTPKKESFEILEDKVKRSSAEKTSELSEDLFKNLLQDSIDSALSVRKSILDKSQLHKKEEQKKVDQKSFSEPKLSSAAQNLLQFLSGDNKASTSVDDLSQQVASDLVDDTLSKVLSIRRSKKLQEPSAEASSKKVLSPEQENGNEVADIVRNAEEVDRVITRPVSPVFGTSQETDEWFDEDFGLAKPSADRNNDMQLRDDWINQLSPSVDGLSSARSEATEIEYLVPHSHAQVLEVTERIVEYLYDMHTQGQLYVDDVTSFEKFDEEIEPENISHKEAVERTFRRSIFELARELLREICDSSEEKTNLFPWHKTKRKRRPSFCRSQPKSKSELITSICDEVVRLLGHRIPAAEPPRVSIKWGNLRKKDSVDLLLIDELRDEEAEWTDYDVDEAAVKTQLTETVFDLLLNDTISCFNRIEQARSGS